MTERLLMADRTHGGEIEAEPVVAAVDGDRLRLVLDDGDVIDLDRSEVAALMREAA